MTEAGFEDAQHAEGVGVGGVFGFFKRYRGKAPGGEVVDFVGLDLLDDADQAGRVGHVAMVEEEAHALFMAILIQMVDAVGVEQAGAPLEAVHFVAFFQQEFGKVGAVLAGDAGDEGGFVGLGHDLDFQLFRKRKSALAGRRSPVVGPSSATLARMANRLSSWNQASSNFLK